jgi:hypothetical protein
VIPLLILLLLILVFGIGAVVKGVIWLAVIALVVLIVAALLGFRSVRRV